MNMFTLIFKAFKVTLRDKTTYENTMIGIDLFAGAGGMSLGAKNAGIDVQVVIEADKHAASTYFANHQPNVSMFADDIRKFTKIELDNFSAKQVILFGGPPCQGFSTSNQKTRNQNNQANWLFREFLRVTQMYKPNWVVFENVKGILETEQGMFVKHVLSSLKKIGYKCECEILNASNYGVPQKRDRFFIVGNLNDISFTFPEPNTLDVVTVKDAIDDLPILKNGASTCELKYSHGYISTYAQLMRGSKKSCNNNIVTRNAPHVLNRYEYIPQGGNWQNIPENLMLNYTDRTRCHTGIYRRLINDKPSVVIGNYRKNMLIHPTQNRGLSVREAARLQSFPDSFVFKGSIGYQQQQVGNAVPPLLGQAIFNKIQKIT